MAILVIFILVWLIRSYSRTKLNNHSHWLVEPGETSTAAVDIKFAPGESLHASCQIDFCPSFFFENFFSKELYLTNKRIILIRRPCSGTRQIRSILFSEIQNVEIAETSPHVKLLLKSGEVYQIAHVSMGMLMIPKTVTGSPIFLSALRIFSNKQERVW
jgi:hypothetical protein